MMKQNMPVDPATTAPGLTASLSGWKAPATKLTTVLAAAIALAFPASDALALSLGRISVLSALGEPLRAEVELPDLSAAEAETLRTEIAPLEAFRAAGLEYSPALNNVRIQLQRRPGGLSVLRLSSDTVVNDPFIDLILQATWASGRTVRDYTILLDPPALRQPPPAVAVAPQVAAPPAPAVRTPPPVIAQRAPAPPQAIAAPPSPSPVPAPAPTRPPVAAPRPAPSPSPAPASAPAAAARAADAQQQVVVRPGDTASRIAAANKPANVSLDQMLVAMLRSNPDAFVRGNVNRMKAGAVLDVPSAAAAGATPPAEASQIITAQSRDFNAFRNRLAGNVPTVQVAGADRRASGRVQAQLDDKRSSGAAPDKLTLSKGALKAQEAEEKIAREKAARDAADRVAELSKNISDLNKLGVATSGASSAASATTPGAAASAPATPAITAPALAAASQAASAPAPATAPPAAPAASSEVAPPAAPVTSTPAVSAPAPPPATAPTPEATPAPAEASDSWMDSLRENPLMPIAAAALVALLAAFGVYRARQRKNAADLDSAFLESRMQPDSFFGASGGQHVDTSGDENGPASSMSYSPSQLDAAGDVDPVAEADVYLAYGRDLQAEEILKEALRTTPTRVAIHTKLLEIYAKRRDATSFGPLAANAFELTDGRGQDWEHIAQLGRELEPDNGMYQTGTDTSSTKPGPLGTTHAALDGTMPTEASPLGEPTTAPSPLPPAPAPQASVEPAPPAMPATPTVPVPPARSTPESLDLDLDLDLTRGHLPERAAAAAATAGAAAAMGAIAAQASPALEEAGPPPTVDLDLDFDLDSHAEPTADQAAAPLTVPAALDLPGQASDDADGLDFDIDLSPVTEADEEAPVEHPAPAPAAAASAAPAPAVDSGLIEFDLGSLSLDLGESTQGGAGAAEPEADSDDPLATKLALAEEFSSIGDEDGARALAEEVLEEATGGLRTRAQRFLSELSS